MAKSKKIIIAVILLVVLLIGIGYAAIQNITLSITGTAEAETSQDNFKVMFSGTPTVSDETLVTATVTDDTHATINVSGLTTKEDTVTATYTVQNVSTDISADLSVATTNDNPEYFTLSSQLEKTSLVEGEATTLSVTIELTKTPITDNVTSTIGIQLTAMPVEPGQEGTSKGINDFSQTPEKLTLSLVTNDNIGDYIDLGNNIIGTKATSDDWRILYKEDDTVYAILADYLPASQVPESAGLTTNTTDYPYSVWSDIDRDILLNGLLNEVAWKDFANGISGATVIGSPTGELLINSYNTEYGTEFLYTLYPILNINSSSENYNLYVPHTSVYENCYRYWLASPINEEIDTMFDVNYNGAVGYYSYNKDGCSARPVVSIPTDTMCNYENGIWKIK